MVEKIFCVNTDLGTLNADSTQKAIISYFGSVSIVEIVGLEIEIKVAKEGRLKRSI